MWVTQSTTAILPFSPASHKTAARRIDRRTALVQTRRLPGADGKYRFFSNQFECDTAGVARHELRTQVFLDGEYGAALAEVDGATFQGVEIDMPADRAEYRFEKTLFCREYQGKQYVDADSRRNRIQIDELCSGNDRLAQGLERRAAAHVFDVDTDAPALGRMRHHGRRQPPAMGNAAGVMRRAQSRP